MTVDESWFVFDANSDCWFFQRLGFFGDMALIRTTKSFQGETLSIQGRWWMARHWWSYWNGPFMGSLAKINKGCRRHKARRGWLTNLFGSLGWRKTNPIKDCWPRASNGCAWKKSQCGVMKWWTKDWLLSLTFVSVFLWKPIQGSCSQILPLWSTFKALGGRFCLHAADLWLWEADSASGKHNCGYVRQILPPESRFVLATKRMRRPASRSRERQYKMDETKFPCFLLLNTFWVCAPRWSLWGGICLQDEADRKLREEAARKLQKVSTMSSLFLFCMAVADINGIRTGRTMITIVRPWHSIWRMFGRRRSAFHTPLSIILSSPRNFFCLATPAAAESSCSNIELTSSVTTSHSIASAPIWLTVSDRNSMPRKCGHCRIRFGHCRIRFSV